MLSMETHSGLVIYSLPTFRDEFTVRFHIALGVNG